MEEEGDHQSHRGEIIAPQRDSEAPLMKEDRIGGQIMGLSMGSGLLSYQPSITIVLRACVLAPFQEQLIPSEPPPLLSFRS